MPQKMAAERVNFSTCSELFKTVAKEALKRSLEKASYQPSTVNALTSSVAEAVLADLQALKKPFKLFATVNLLQGASSGFHCSTSCLVAPEDGSCSVKWTTPNSAITAVATVHGVSL
jgi:hypothetical protein